MNTFFLKRKAICLLSKLNFFEQKRRPEPPEPPDAWIFTLVRGFVTL